MGKRAMLQYADELEKQDCDSDMEEEDKVKFRAFKAKFVPLYRSLATLKPEDVVLVYKPPGDTQEEHLTAEEMEARFSGHQVCPQVRHFATLALAHYNATKKTKSELATVLLSKCFTEMCGTTFAHVNFTATVQNQNATRTASAKRFFFAELMLIPELQAYKDTEPMRVLHVCTIDDLCFGGCHEMKRDIKKALRKNLDFERCHACSARIKHPRGDQFIAGHNSTRGRGPYFSAI